MELSEKEKKIISDREFLISKMSIIGKVQSLFENVRDELNKTISSSDFSFPEYVDAEIGKIFRGENYRSLPYVVLDYPKYFSELDTFAFRTMFWWGNFFSTTLHIDGKSADNFRSIIFSNAVKLIDENIFICVNDTPWEYHYEKDNYMLLERDNLALINEVEFIKLSKKYDLDKYNRLPIEASEFLRFCIDLINS